MGIFKRSTDPEAERVLAYLDGAPAGSREEWLHWASVLRVGELPVATAERAGAVVTMSDLAPAVELIRHIMRQDRDLSGKLVRKSIVNLKAVLVGGMHGDFPANFESGVATMGLESLAGAGGVTFTEDSGSGLAAAHAQAARALADLVIALMTVHAAGPDEQPRQAGWKYYVELQTGGSDRDAEEDAYTLSAWSSVLINRLRNTDQLRADVPFFSWPWGYVPELSQAGWYPAPNKTTKLVDGLAPFQRYWDGSRWTDRSRVRAGRDWRTGTDPLHDPPEMF